jgi:hypothetical protein
MIQEIWKPIPMAPGYEASNLGNIKSLDRTIFSDKRNNFFRTGKILTPTINKNGYKMVLLGRGKSFYVHYLVLATFVGVRPNGMSCSHKDNNKLNNNIDNLFYESLADNIRRQAIHGTKQQGEKNGHAKLNAKDVLYIRSLKNTGYGFFAKLSRQFSVNSTTIRDAYNGGTWKCLS